jgi:predicted DNA-binding protein
MKAIKKNLATKANKGLIVNLELSKALEEHLNYLEVVSKRSKEFIIQEALIRYLEDAEDISKALEENNKGKTKTYTTKELLEHLNLKNI